MELLTGEVGRLNLSTEVSGDEHGIGTLHVATFLIETLPVRVKKSQSIPIHNGDHIAVVGHTKNGVFNVVAYKNLTNGALSTGSLLSHYIFGTLLTTIGVGLLVFLFALERSEFCWGVPALIIGLWTIFRADRLKEAYLLVEAQTG